MELVHGPCAGRGALLSYFHAGLEVASSSSPAASVAHLPCTPRPVADGIASVINRPEQLSVVQRSIDLPCVPSYDNSSPLPCPPSPAMSRISSCTSLDTITEEDGGAGESAAPPPGGGRGGGLVLDRMLLALDRRHWWVKVTGRSNVQAALRSGGRRRQNDWRSVAQVLLPNSLHLDGNMRRNTRRGRILGSIGGISRLFEGPEWKEMVSMEAMKRALREPDATFPRVRARGWLQEGLGEKHEVRLDVAYREPFANVLSETGYTIMPRLLSLSAGQSGRRSRFLNYRVQCSTSCRREPGGVRICDSGSMAGASIESHLTILGRSRFRIKKKRGGQEREEKKEEKKKPFSAIVGPSHLTIGGSLGGLVRTRRHSLKVPFLDYPEPEPANGNESSSKSSTLQNSKFFSRFFSTVPFAACGLSLQFGKFTRPLLDYTAVDIRIDDLGAFCSDRRRTITASLSQQVAGPFRARVQATMEPCSPDALALPRKPVVPVALMPRCVGDKAVRIHDMTFGVDMAVPPLEGSARALVWISPMRREAMAEVRFWFT